MVKWPAWFAEDFAYYAAALFLLLLRLVLRTVHLGFRGWQLDDHYSLLAAFTFTATIVLTHYGSIWGTTSGLTPEAAAKMTPEQLHLIRKGSVCDFFDWAIGAVFVAATKLSILVFFGRVTNGLWQKRVINWLTWYLVATVVAIWFADIFKCGLPVSKNWETNPPPGICVEAHPILWITGLSNCSSDLILIGIIIPSLWRVKLPWHKKLLTGLMLCSGIFATIISFIRMVWSLIADTQAFLWAYRECLTMIAVANLPIIYITIVRLYRSSRQRPNSVMSKIIYSTRGKPAIPPPGHGMDIDEVDRILESNFGMAATDVVKDEEKDAKDVTLIRSDSDTSTGASK